MTDVRKLLEEAVEGLDVFFSREQILMVELIATIIYARGRLDGAKSLQLVQQSERQARAKSEH